MMHAKGLHSCVVNLSFEELHVQSGHIPFLKSTPGQHERMQNTFQNAEFAAGNCTHICSISNIYFWTNINCNPKNEFVIYIYTHTHIW